MACISGTALPATCSLLLPFLLPRATTSSCRQTTPSMHAACTTTPPKHAPLPRGTPRTARDRCAPRSAARRQFTVRPPFQLTPPQFLLCIAADASRQAAVAQDATSALPTALPPPPRCCLAPPPNLHALPFTKAFTFPIPHSCLGRLPPVAVWDAHTFPIPGGRAALPMPARAQPHLLHPCCCLMPRPHRAKLGTPVCLPHLPPASGTPFLFYSHRGWHRFALPGSGPDWFTVLHSRAPHLRCKTHGADRIHTRAHRTPLLRAVLFQ